MPTRPVVAIVDDDESIRDTTKDLLESAGLAAATFGNAPLLLRSRRLKSVSCLVADTRMPEMSGLELHQYLVTSGHSIPTILMTTYPDERVRAQAVKSGVVCYLVVGETFAGSQPNARTSHEWVHHVIALLDGLEADAQRGR